MKKLIEIIMIIVGGYLVISFLRWVFSVTPGTLKFAHWGISTFGFNVVETIIVLAIVYFIFRLLLKND